MKKHHLLSLVLLTIIVALALIFLWVRPIEEPEIKSGAQSSQRDLSPAMTRNFEALMELQKFALDEESFNAPQNEARIQKLIGQLASISHDLPQMMDRPGLTGIAIVFHDYLSHLQDSFTDGEKEYARNQVKTLSGFCFSCHTTTVSADAVVDFRKQVEKLSLSPLNRAEFLASVRQFDDSLKEYEAIIEESPANEDGITQLSEALKGALSIVVRVKQDPHKALDILEQVKSKSALPYFLKNNIKQWEKDLKSWQDETTAIQDLQGDAILNKAKELIRHAEEVKSFPADHAGDISYLRANNHIHHYLMTQPETSKRAEAFLVLGITNGALEDYLLWDLDRFYYEACIKEVPHSDQAKRCFNRLSSKMLFDYSGSSGTDLPPEEQERLNRFRQLAE